MQEELTPNEEQILQAIRNMKNMDQILIIKKGKTGKGAEFEVRTQSVAFFFRTGLDKG